jgi:hypothetical protein
MPTRGGSGEQHRSVFLLIEKIIIECPEGGEAYDCVTHGAILEVLMVLL